MIRDVDQLDQLLESEFLSDQNILSLDIPNSIDKAFAIEVRDNGLQMWTAFRKRLPQTGMWPVLYAFWGNPQNSWEDYVKADDMFKRQPFEWETQEDRDTSPEAIVARSEITSFEGVLEKHANLHSQNLEEDFAYALEKTYQRFAMCPQASEVEALIRSNHINNYIQLEKWLMDWELQHVPREKSLQPNATHYVDWYVPRNQPQALILLPTPHCWEVLAYIHWYGAQTYGSETAIAMLRWWNEKHGAELVAHYGTMLHFQVIKQPINIEDAFRLAWEQEAFAPCTTALPGESLRDHARTLLHTDKWFLHERP
ncbi:MAG: DUF4253 domain-containing protein [Gammaproteobacteria bacterium]|jgi:hypothetical protein|nr:DUF4253 domain-containing protein [Gammaproteobacteria bacterium]